MEALASSSTSYRIPVSGPCISRLGAQTHQGLRLSCPSLSHAALSANATNVAAAQKRPLLVTASAAGVAAAPVAVFPVLKFDGATGGEAELSLKTAKPETAKGLVHRAVIRFLQNKRRGTASTLTRAEVRGGGRKPYKQKGTGRARQGSTRTPLRPGGGVVFGPKPKDWSIQMNKKERRLAIGTALQSAAVNMTVVEDVDDSDFPLPKTRDFVAALSRWGVDFKHDNTLFVTGQISKNVDLSSRNIEKLKVATAQSVNIYDVLRADKVVVTLSGLAYLNRRFGGEYESEEDDAGDAGVVLRMVGGSLVLEGEEGEELALDDAGEVDAEDGELGDGE